MFDHHCFVEWMRKLLATLQTRNITNEIIIMDNAKYHKKLPEDTPRASDNKSRLQEACIKYGISFEFLETKAMLWRKLHRYTNKNVFLLSCKWQEMPDMMWYILRRSTPICSQLKLYGRLWKAKLVGNTLLRLHSKTFLCGWKLFSTSVNLHQQGEQPVEKTACSYNSHWRNE